ncbi:MAG: DUF6036 family nucleotidyltransferase [Lachnospiraceae bacterium]|nr:DUF6036 family nucleotidyltransferase [Lachnospiraceae bacterium]
MLSENNREITVLDKSNLDECLSDLGKEYRRLAGKRMPAEIILVGGAAVIANYDFRPRTQDVDAMICGAGAIKDAAHNVAEKRNLSYDWLNTDFTNTSSYSPKLRQYSKYYKQFSNVLTVRTVSSEYLIAMKLCSDREYKHDQSDIAGILNEHEKSKNPISLQQIRTAVIDLYGSWDYLPENSRSYIEKIYENKNFEQTYHQMEASEKQTKRLLSDFEEKYPGVLKQSNLSEITAKLRAKDTAKAVDAAPDDRS